MPTTEPQGLLHRLAVGDAEVVASLADQYGGSDDATTVIVIALFADPDGTRLRHARELAATTRERQMVAIAAAHVRGEHELVDALARDHLTDHPDSVVVAWIAAKSQHALQHPSPPQPGANDAGS